MSESNSSLNSAIGDLEEVKKHRVEKFSEKLTILTRYQLLHGGSFGTDCDHFQAFFGGFIGEILDLF